MFFTVGQHKTRNFKQHPGSKQTQVEKAFLSLVTYFFKVVNHAYVFVSDLKLLQGTIRIAGNSISKTCASVDIT